MTRTVAFVVVVAFLSNCAHNLIHYRHYEKTNMIVTSARVGETIDFEEREQFGLFPGIDGFKSATFYGIAAGGYEVWITTENKNFIAVNRDSLATVILGDYIDRCEEIGNSRKEFERKWKIVDYDDLGLAITQYEVDRIRKTGSAMLIGGAIGCAGGFFPFIALAQLVGEQVDVNSDVGDAIFFSGLALSTATGVWLGHRLSRTSALKAIRESREPRIME